MIQRTVYLKFASISALLLGGILLIRPAVRAADEVCTSCGPEVSLSGNFAHRREGPRVNITGAGNNVAAYREDVDGSDFTVTIPGLPAGKYTITIGEVDTEATAAGQRVFTVTSGDTTIARDFDIFTAAGGANKVTSFSGTVDHGDDALKGALCAARQSCHGRADSQFDIASSLDSVDQITGHRSIDSR